MQTVQFAHPYLALLGDDKEFNDAIKEESELAYGNELRTLFVTLLIMNNVQTKCSLKLFYLKVTI